MLDLLNGQVVHAVKGVREKYQPVKSMLCDSSEPIHVARAFREQLGADELYVADLDAIQTGEQASHRELIETLLRERFKILLDAGVADKEMAYRWLKSGIEKVIIGSETLSNWETLQELPTHIPAQHLIFSLDMRGGRILSRCSKLARMDQFSILEQLLASGWHEIILLDLERVGSEAGIDLEMVGRVRNQFPELSLVLGGGITGMEELLALKQLGVAGALMATMLHRGKLSAEQVRLLK